VRALLACPTGSIGMVHQNNASEFMHDFPLHLEDGVYYTGFNSPKSYGGHSYVVQHPAGNRLIDSPKYLPYLIRRFEELGGIQYIFLTHRDDVAEAHTYTKRFGSQRIIHRAELSAQRDAECVIDGHTPLELSSEFTIIPTPANGPVGADKGVRADSCAFHHRAGRRPRVTSTAVSSTTAAVIQEGSS
jgi:hypothetical protein